MKFCDRLLETVQPVWEMSHNHPFVVGMGDGTLEKINSVLYYSRLFISARLCKVICDWCCKSNESTSNGKVR